MKPKATKYVLIAGVVLIWGIVIYRVIKGLKRDNEFPVVNKRVAPFKYDAVKDSFILFANYPDPFLASVETDTAETNKIPSTAQNFSSEIYQKNHPVQRPPQIDINSIRYQGMIANPEKKKKVAFLTIAGKEYTVKENDKIEGLVIRKITIDKISVFANGKTEIIGRKKD